MFEATPLSQELIEPDEDGLEVLFRRLWPRVEVFNFLCQYDKENKRLISRAYSDNMVVLHVPR